MLVKIFGDNLILNFDNDIFSQYYMHSPKNPWIEDFFSLKSENVRFDLLILSQNTENSPILSKNYLKYFNLILHFTQITEMLKQLFCLFFFCIRIFRYVLIFSKRIKLLNRSTKFPGIFQPKGKNFFK